MSESLSTLAPRQQEVHVRDTCRGHVHSLMPGPYVLQSASLRAGETSRNMMWQHVCEAPKRLTSHDYSHIAQPFARTITHDNDTLSAAGCGFQSFSAIPPKGGRALKLLRLVKCVLRGGSGLFTKRAQHNLKSHLTVQVTTLRLRDLDKGYLASAMQCIVAMLA